jgi:hypothetical protein
MFTKEAASRLCEDTCWLTSMDGECHIPESLPNLMTASRPLPLLWVGKDTHKTGDESPASTPIPATQPSIISFFSF